MVDSLDLKTIEQRLAARAQQLGAAIDAARRRVDDDVPTDVVDTKEIANAEVAALVGDAAIERALAELRSIDAARLRIGEGRYGACVDCDAAIEPDRLLAEPEASRCVVCQARAERAAAAHPRRHAGGIG